MTAVQAIIAKELRTAFVSPIVYVVGAVFLLSHGLLSFVMVQIAGTLALGQMQFQDAAAQLNLNELVFRPVFYWCGVYFLLVLLPILTMRLFAEEHKLRTFELLATSPIGIKDIVLGKFLGAFVIYLGILTLTGVGPLILSLFSSFSWQAVLTGYLGLALLGGLYLSVGVLASALTENQIIAALVGFGLLLLLWLAGALGANLGDSPFGIAVSYISFGEHFGRLVRGLLDTSDLVYFASGIGLMLFLTHRVVESERWK